MSTAERSIAIVDTDSNTRLVIEKSLRRKGQYTHISSKEEFENLLNNPKQVSSLIIIRLELDSPYSDEGLTMLSRLRNALPFINTPIIALSSHAEEPQVRNYCEDNKVGLLSFPVLPKKLNTLTEYLLSLNDSHE